MEKDRELALRNRQLAMVGEMWCAAAEAALRDIPGASNTSHPANWLWLRVQMHRMPPAEVVLSTLPQEKTNG